MTTKDFYIESLDIPESDRELLYRFKSAGWENTYPEQCKSEKARQAARDMALLDRCRDERDAGID